MLAINSITNVKNTINRNISFTSGVRTNYRANAINGTADVKHEGRVLTDFLGTIKQSPLFYETFLKRQEKIEKEMNKNENRFNAFA